MKLVNVSIAVVATCLLATSAYALKTADLALKGNSVVEYIKIHSDVNSIGKMFTEGKAYGRIRSNMFWWDWDTEKTSGMKQTRDNNMWGWMDLLTPLLQKPTIRSKSMTPGRQNRISVS
ncbi:MAG: hypothetical protein IE883_02045 [Epsilonproteobacteria bacterium]|nr:hypothetical protein [Campylobacterota bacterium]